MALSKKQIREKLYQRRDAVLEQLATLTAQSLGGLPNTSGTGDHIDHVAYKKSLYEELSDIEKALEILEGPQESHTRGRLI